MKLEVELEIEDHRIQDLIVTAFEGGSNYWIEEIKTKKVPKTPFQSEFDKEHGFKIIPIYSYPLSEGGEIEIFTTEGERGVLNRSILKKALLLMRRDYYDHYIDFVDEQDDVDTADIFLQLCILGGLVYG